MPPNTDICILLFQTLVEETASKELFEDTHSLLREILTEMSVNIDAGLSFKFTPTEGSLSNTSLNVELSSQYERKEMIKTVTENTKIKVNIL